jgi:hypothetical protein
MDIGLFIVLMIVVYVVPELLKRMKKKQPYQYPDFPTSQLPTGQYPSAPGIPGELSRGMKPPPMPIYAAQEEGTAGDEGDPDWGVRMAAPVSEIGGRELEDKSDWVLGPNQALQGLVWAEIISPPLALRHLRHSRGRF